MSDSPKVSIGMPVRNGGQQFRQALSALLVQDYADFELIISDNGSADDTPEIAKQAAARDSRVIYSRAEPPVGPIANFNRVLGMARGEYFMWAAHDDLWEPQFLSRLVKVLDADAEAVLAFCRFDNIDDRGEVVKTFDNDWGTVFSSSKFTQVARLTMRDETRSQKANHIYGLMRREALLRVGGMREEVAEFCGEDILTLLRLLGHGNFRIVDALLFRYRVRPVPPKPEGQTLLQYIRMRFAGKPTMFRGNFLLYLRRHHVYHQAMRTAIGELPLGFSRRLVLRLMVFAREIAAPVWTIPRIVIQELRAQRRRVFY